MPLPDKLAETLEVAYNDMLAVEQRDDCYIDMAVWYREYSDHCVCCLAGSTIRMGHTATYVPGNILTHPEYNKLAAIDYCRVGDLVKGVVKFYEYGLTDGMTRLRAAVQLIQDELAHQYGSFQGNRLVWEAYIKAVIARLKEIGV